MKQFSLILSVFVLINIGFSQTPNQDFVFLENKGQFDGRIKFSTQQEGVKMYLGAKSIHYVWSSYTSAPTENELDKLQKKQRNATKETYRVNLELIGANLNSEIIKSGSSKDFVKYYTSLNKEAIQVFQYSKIVYKNIYNGIDWVWYNNNGNIKYDFIVHPGADYEQIKIKVSGATKVFISKDGSLKIKSPMGEINEAPPVSFIGKEIVQTHFNINESVVSFGVEDYPKTETLTIDPQLLWRTYYGGSEYDEANGVINSKEGDVYVCGLTDSDNNIFFNGYQNKTNGFSRGAFIVKFDKEGKRLWATYYGGYSIGGNGKTSAESIDIDENGNIYVIGTTDVSDSISSNNVHQPNLGGKNDALLIKFSPNGDLIWATYYGGGKNETGDVVKVKGNEIYIGGSTESSSVLSQTQGPFKLYSGKKDVFIAAIDSTGKRIWGGYFGGSQDEFMGGMAFDSKGDLYFSGTTYSPSGIYSIYRGGHQLNLRGSRDAFLVKTEFGEGMDWSTYYGGEGLETSNGVFIDDFDNIYLTGKTFLSTNSIATNGAYKTTLSGDADAFIAKFSRQGVRQWGTYEGGEAIEDIYSSAINPATGDIYISGTTQSNTGVFLDGLKQKSSQEWDLFISKFDRNGIKKWGTYLNGDSAEDKAFDMNVDRYGLLYVVGAAGFDSNFGLYGHQNIYGGGIRDGFVSLIRSEDLNPLLSVTNVGPLCSNINYQFVAFKPLERYKINWFNEQNDTVPFFTGDTLNTILKRSDTIWVALGDIDYTGPKKPIITSIIPVPNIKFSISDSVVCQINNKIICINEDVDTTAFYTWDFGDGFLSSAATDTHTYLNAGVYVISLRGKYANSSCSGTKSKFVKILTSPANQKVTGPLSSGQGKSEAYSAKFVVGSKYIWTAQGGSLEGNDSSASIIVNWDTTTTVGRVGVSEINNLGCKSFEVAVNVFLDPITKSIKEIDEDLVKIFPNPVKNRLNISTKEIVAYHLYDLTGREVLNGVVDKNAIIELQPFNLKEGLYSLYFYKKGMPMGSKKIYIE